MKRIIQYILPVTLTLFMCVSVERTVVTDGGYDRLYGLPLAYRSNNAGCTGCYEVYIYPMIVDLLFFWVIAMGLAKLVERARIHLRTNIWGMVVGVAVSLFWVWLFVLMTTDSRFLLTNHTAYKTTKRELVVGVR